MCDSTDCLDCGDDGLSQARNFEDRLITFINWTNKVSPKELASAGFYFTQNEDIVKCAFCHCEFNDWKEDDDPLEDHYKYMKHCVLANVLWRSRQLKKNKHTRPVSRREKKNTHYTYKVSSFGTCFVLAVFICGLFYSYKTIIDVTKEF